MTTTCVVGSPTSVATKSIVCVSLDIEGTGDRFDAPIAAIGCVVGDAYGTVFERRCWCIKLDESEIEPRCKLEFWDKQKGLWERIQKDAKPEAEATANFVSFWNHLELTYPSELFKWKILSDNPAYDITRIDYLVWKHLKRLPIRYTTAGVYRSIEDPSEQAYGTLDESVCWKRAEAKCKHTHWPLDDAEFIYHLYQEVMNMKSNQGQILSTVRSLVQMFP